jgi:hypothetical protein
MGVGDGKVSPTNHFPNPIDPLDPVYSRIMTWYPTKRQKKERTHLLRIEPKFTLSLKARVPTIETCAFLIG